MTEYPEWMCELMNGGDDGRGGEKNVGRFVDMWKAGREVQEAKRNPLLLVDRCKDFTLVPFLKTLDKILNQK